MKEKKKQWKNIQKGTMMKKIILMPMDSEETWHKIQIEKKTSLIKKDTMINNNLHANGQLENLKRKQIEKEKKS